MLLLTVLRLLWWSRCLECWAAALCWCTRAFIVGVVAGSYGCWRPAAAAVECVVVAIAIECVVVATDVVDMGQVAATIGLVGAAHGMACWCCKKVVIVVEGGCTMDKAAMDPSPPRALPASNSLA